LTLFDQLHGTHPPSLQILWASSRSHTAILCMPRSSSHIVTLLMPDSVSSFPGKAVHQEVGTPARHAALHDVALFARMVLDQAECQATQPGEVFRERAVADPAFVFPVGHVERPVQR